MTPALLLWTGLLGGLATLPVGAPEGTIIRTLLLEGRELAEDGQAVETRP